MKRSMVVLALMLFCVALLGAGQQSKGIAVEYKNVAVTVVADQKPGDGKSYPIVEAALLSGEKERFGLGAPAAGEKVIEILDRKGAVVKSLSGADLFGGKGSSAFSAGSVDAGSRRMERVASVDLPGGKVQILLRAIATGDVKAGGADRHLVLMLGLKAQAAMTLGLRMSMKSIGILQAGDHGFILLSNAGGGVLNAAVSPAGAVVTAGKGKVVVTSPAIALDGVSESPAFWLIMDAQTAVTPAAAKAAGLAALKEKRSSMNDPHLVVVSATDKQTTQPGDTVAFTVTCTNIGASGATDVTVNNPVPEGMAYVEGSATSSGCTVSMDRAADGVKKISWTFTEPVGAGSERVVSFKARIR